MEPVNGRWIDVAALTDLVDGEGKLVRAGSIGAYVFRHGDSVTAVSSLCSHLPCELNWNASARLLVCPYHPATFRPEGHSAGQRCPLPALSRVIVRVTQAGRVEVLGTA